MTQRFQQAVTASEAIVARACGQGVVEGAPVRRAARGPAGAGRPSPVNVRLACPEGRRATSPGFCQLSLNLDAPGRDYMAEPMDKARDRVIDELLVVRCQEGRRECFEMLIRRWQRRLWRYARTLTGSSDAAWDVTQETWIAILRQIRKLTDPAWFGAWAHRIVRNKSADHCRRAGRQRNLAEAVAERERAKDNPGREGHGDAVAEALRRLPPDRQELLTLRYGGDLNVVEIAVILGIPAGTVKSRLHHAREQLRRILEGDES